MGSLFIIMTIVYIGLDKGLLLLIRDEPYISTLQVELAADDPKQIPLYRISKPLVGIWGGGAKAFAATELNRHSRRYFHVSVLNIIKTYDGEEGYEVMTKIINRYPVGPCPDDFFKTEFEIKFW